MEKVLRDLNDDFRQFTGTQHYYRGLGLNYTDGIKVMADKFGAHWLIDIVASYQKKLSDYPFQIWTIKSENNKAVVEMIEDTGKPVIVRQKINFTDFPAGELKMYCIDRILILPSEY